MNERIFKVINQCAGTSSLLDSLMILISKKARFVYLFVIIILWFRRTDDKRMTVNTGFTLGVTYIICLFIKSFFFRPRPFLTREVNLLSPVPSEKDSTFPSKHTSLAFAMAASVFCFHKVAGGFLWLLSVMVGVSRIWMGQHYPSDIAGSAIIGKIVAYMVKRTELSWKPLVKRALQPLKNF